MQIVDPNLHLLPWSRETGKDINSVPAANYTAVNVAGAGPSGKALSVTNTSTQDGGADLVTVKRPNYAALHPDLNLKYVRLRCKMFISAADRAKIGRLETDMKACMVIAPKDSTSKVTPIRNVPNASTQLNFTNGYVQIDSDPPGWKNTMFKPVIPVDIWFDYYHDLMIDPIAKTFTVVGMGYGSQIYKTVAPDPQNVPWQTSTWRDLILAIQLQIMIFKAGSVSVYYDLMDLVWSDIPLS
jgi:hypothetical protein